MDRIPIVVLYAVVGLGSGSILALTKLRSDLCLGEDVPTKRQRSAAWSQFAIFMWTSLFFSAALTGWLTDHFGKLATWPLVASGIGLLCNGLWPLVTAATNEKVAERISAVLDAFRGVKS